MLRLPNFNFKLAVKALFKGRRTLARRFLFGELQIYFSGAKSGEICRAI